MELKSKNFYRKIVFHNPQIIFLFLFYMLLLLFFTFIYGSGKYPYWLCLLETIFVSIIAFSLVLFFTITVMYIQVNEKRIIVKGYYANYFLDESDVFCVDIKEIVSLDFEIQKRIFNAEDYATRWSRFDKKTQDYMYKEIGKAFMIITDKEGNKLKILINDFNFEPFKKLLITLKEALKINHNQYYKEIDPNKIIEELSNNMDNPMESTYILN